MNSSLQLVNDIFIFIWIDSQNSTFSRMVTNFVLFLNWLCYGTQFILVTNISNKTVPIKYMYYVYVPLVISVSDPLLLCARLSNSFRSEFVCLVGFLAWILPFQFVFVYVSRLYLQFGLNDGFYCDDVCIEFPSALPRTRTTPLPPHPTTLQPPPPINNNRFRVQSILLSLSLSLSLPLHTNELSERGAEESRI